MEAGGNGYSSRLFARNQRTPSMSSPLGRILCLGSVIYLLRKADHLECLANLERKMPVGSARIAMPALALHPDAKCSRLPEHVLITKAAMRYVNLNQNVTTEFAMVSFLSFVVRRKLCRPLCPNGLMSQPRYEMRDGICEIRDTRFEIRDIERVGLGLQASKHGLESRCHDIRSRIMDG